MINLASRICLPTTESALILLLDSRVKRVNGRSNCECAVRPIINQNILLIITVKYTVHI